MLKPIHLPGLNGIRTIAALAVVLSHITLSLRSFGLEPLTAHGLELGGYSVTIFFVLSGFLITYLLLREKADQPINIKFFYIRRMLRIWPLYYLYLILSLLTIFFFGISYNKSTIPFYVFLLANIPFILSASLPFLAHYWSLAIEEQFYLFWPFLVKRSGQKFLKLVITITVSLIIIKIIFRILDIKYGWNLPYLAITVNRFHCMMMGGIGAVLYFRKDDRFLRLTSSKITQCFCWIILLFIMFNKFHFASVIDGDIVSALTVCIIISQVTKTNRIINLDTVFFDFIGKISFGIYIYHPLIIFFISKLLFYKHAGALKDYVTVYVSVLLATLAVSWLSYNFFERFFLRKKNDFSPVKSSPGKNN